ncbi:MAG: D-alanyl-D-alanine carboxypeptidase [Drouetiella hepatica Uher 2000/2452]|jgi:D-alanyl-D-alanine carboxypeptidase/D-alanyl-D-alanine-endopeptidase (penicillin-binding protein 4)|uniref:D-alanyl-D-alanine carboxypeptidase n=1 Tax=Drouetiella hepatica Uher 2000/2452 TaxID=904376 RepID=A0A951Q7H2_9CYAN|nr:D-alanyl-D-alanine carboxypeptidase [Drouetiella hepatica Uher 2000/2452]
MNWSGWLDSSLVQTLTTPIPDPAAEAAIQQHLDALKAMGFPPENQAVLIQMGNQTLAEHQSSTPLSAASLTKIATTLAALTTWGPDYQFETLVSTNGTLKNGVLNGDLIVLGTGDPFFVWEEAIALGNALNQAGVRQVTGDLVITGNFSMNFEPMAASGDLLKQGLDADLWSGEAAAQYEKLPVGTPRPQVKIMGAVRVGAMPGATSQPLIRHQSMPLATILKSMNIYSNNPMSEMLANSLGGAQVVAQKAAEAANVPIAEIQIARGSGLGVENRISSRAVVAMLISIQDYLQKHQMDVSDLFPIAGRDGGTLEGRLTPESAVVKTGTLNEVSAFAGVLPTRDRGLIWFAIINLGAGDIGDFHDQQDRLLENLQASWGKPVRLPAEVIPGDRSRNPINWLGNASRNQVL